MQPTSNTYDQSPEGSFKRQKDSLLPKGYHFPFFTILSLVKPD